VDSIVLCKVIQVPFCVLSKDDARFQPFLKTLDSLSSELHSNGIGVVQNSAEVIELEHKMVFWSIGIFNSKNFALYSVFFSKFCPTGRTRAA